MQHIREFHAYSPAFTITCGLNGCPRTFTKFSSFRSHVYDWHAGDPLISNICYGPSVQTEHAEETEEAMEHQNNTEKGKLVLQ